ncbi:hypothetical protein [Erysipelothrix anatis]|uniref:hypothetical protein n=1 Tax=Erysipelothrix anatis TaxID=2683713 RepID=UPI0013593D8D|nr:hypothetical protein [Erysipelothrix anatis]
MRRTRKIIIILLVGLILSISYLYLSGWKLSASTYIEELCFGLTLPQCEVVVKEDINQRDTLYIIETETRYLPIIFEQIGPLSRPKILSGMTLLESQPVIDSLRFYPKNESNIGSAITSYLTQPTTTVLAFPGETDKYYEVAIRKGEYSSDNLEGFSFDAMFEMAQPINKRNGYYIHVLPNSSVNGSSNYVVTEYKTDGTKVKTTGDYFITVTGTVIASNTMANGKRITEPTPVYFNGLLQNRIHDLTLIKEALEAEPLTFLVFADAKIDDVPVNDLQITRYPLSEWEAVLKLEWTDQTTNTKQTEYTTTWIGYDFINELFDFAKEG